jgi:proton glutamate symport protein
MKRTLLILAGLVCGLVAGILISHSGSPALLQLVAVAEMVGTAWVNLLRMTVLPLIVALLVVGVGSARDAGRTGKITAKALALFITLYCAVAVYAILAAPPLLARLAGPPGGGVVSGAAAGEAGAPAAAAGIAEQIVNVIPINPFKAAANGDLLPLVVFSILFGFALASGAGEGRRTVLGFFVGVRDVMLTLVHWILALAPVGVFCIALPLAGKLGPSIVRELASYVVISSGLLVPVIAAMYAMARLAGGISLRRFAQGCIAAQSVAVSTQSSVASLPAMLEGAEGRIGLPARVTGVVLPLAVSIFRLAGPLWYVVAALFTARLYGIDLSTAQMVTLTAISALIPLGGIGLPGNASRIALATAVFVAVDLPLEAIPILLAVEIVPDVFQTVTNVTADVAATAVVARHTPSSEPDDVWLADSAVAHAAAGNR